MPDYLPPDARPSEEDAASVGVAVDSRRSPETEGAAAVLSSFLKAVRADQLYPRHARVRADMVAEFAARLTDHLESFGALDLRVGPTALTVADEPALAEDDPRERGLPQRLFARGVRRLHVERGCGPEDAEGLVELLAHGLDLESATEDFRTAAWERDFRRVRFHLSDDGEGEPDRRELAELVAQSAVDPGSAVAARQETDLLVCALEALPEPAEGDSLRLSQEERNGLAAEAARELARDLVAELCDVLAELLEANAAGAVESHLDRFVEHLLATGAMERAARLFSALRRNAARAADPERRRILSETADRIGRARLVPRLESLLAAFEGPEREAVAALLDGVGEAAVAPLCALLDTPVRETAIQALKLVGPRNPGALLPFLGDARPHVVRIVLLLLGDSGATGIGHSVGEALADPDAGVRREAVRALARLGEDGTPHLLAAIDDPSYEVRALALTALAETRDPRAVEPLLSRVARRSFRSASNYERRETFRALGLIGGNEAVRALARMLGSRRLLDSARREELRVLAAQALALVGTPAARHCLQIHADDPSERVQRAVQLALSEVDRQLVERARIVEER